MSLSKCNIPLAALISVAVLRFAAPPPTPRFLPESGAIYSGDSIPPRIQIVEGAFKPNATLVATLVDLEVPKEIAHNIARLIQPVFDVRSFHTGNYFKVEKDTNRVPGNPWFICTLWMAQWCIATAKTVNDLKAAREIVDWVVAHQQHGGLLSEQLDPNTGAPLSVSPLTWSAAELITTVDEFCRMSERIRRSALSTVPPVNRPRP